MTSNAQKGVGKIRKGKMVRRLFRLLEGKHMLTQATGTWGSSESGLKTQEI